MTESASPLPAPDADAAAAARLAEARKRKEKREAKIRARGSDRLNKISGVGGGLQREAEPVPKAPSQDHADPDEVDISQHYYEPRTTVRPAAAEPALREADAAAADAQLRALLAAQPNNPFLGGDVGAGGGAGAGAGAEEDPMAAMLSQMMASMGGVPGMGATPAPGGANGPGLAGMPGWPPMPQQQQKQAVPSTPAALWRLVHFAVAVALGLYVALATPFAGTQREREQAAEATSYQDWVDELEVHKRYFFYAFATAETVLLTSRFFLERGGRGAGVGVVAGGGILATVLGFLPPTLRRTIELTLRYWQIFSAVRADLLVCIFVLGVCSWVRA